jgi:hypothetical protein
MGSQVHGYITQSSIWASPNLALTILYLIYVFEALSHALSYVKENTLEESLSITTGRCDLAIATRARKMHKKISI